MKVRGRGWQTREFGGREGRRRGGEGEVCKDRSKEEVEEGERIK